MLVYKLLYIVLRANTRNAITQNICLYEILMKRKVQLDHLVEGIGSLGFSEVLIACEDIMQHIFVGGMKKPTTEELLAHFDIVYHQIEVEQQHLNTCRFISRS